MGEEDVGLRTLRYLFDRLSVDAERHEWGDRAFTWTPGAGTQRVWATTPQDSEGIEISSVRAETEVFRMSRDDWHRCRPFVEDDPANATMSMWMWEEGSVWLRCGAVTHQAIADQWMSEVLAVAAMEQLLMAQQAIGSMFASGETALESYPSLQPATDDIYRSGNALDLIDALGQERRAEALLNPLAPSPFQGLFREVLPMLEAHEAVATADDENLVADFALELPSGLTLPGGRLFMTTRLEYHPKWGQGLLLVLTLDGAPADGGGPIEPTRLNLLEWTSPGVEPEPYLFGTWCSGHAWQAISHQFGINAPTDRPAFMLFIPNLREDGIANILNAPVLYSLVLAMRARAYWTTILR